MGVLDADSGMGTTLEVRNGKFTGRVSGLYPFSKDKIAALRRVLNGKPVNYSESYGFGDSVADIPLLARFGHPVAMNPDWGLRRAAKKRGWKIVVEYPGRSGGR